MGTPSTLRLLNRTVVFDAMRAHAPVSRAEIARLTSISAPTVSAIVNDLVAEGFVRELPPNLSEGSKSDGGRPPRLLVFSEDIRYLGCDLSASDAMRVGLVNLSDRVTEMRTVEYAATPPNPEQIVELLGRALADWESGRGGGARIRGIGVGVPGVTDVESGVVQSAPSFAWRNVALGDMITARLGIQTVVENDVNLALIGEVHQGVAKNARHAALVSFREGVGGAVLIDSRLYRGRGAAGEVGYLVTDWRPTEDLRGFGATELRLSGLLADECKARNLDFTAETLASSILISHLLAGESELVLRPSTKRSLTQTIASLLASVVALLDPEVVVLSGWIESLTKSHVAEIQKELDRLVPSRRPALRVSQLGSTATLAGAGITAHRAATEFASLIPER
jgi:glucokinase